MAIKRVKKTEEQGKPKGLRAARRSRQKVEAPPVESPGDKESSPVTKESWTTGRRAIDPSLQAMQSAHSVVAGIRAYFGAKKKLSAANVSVSSDDALLEDVTEFIPTGIPTVDNILGGGFPVGRCTEIFGPEACGKTALVHSACYEVQKLGGTATFHDLERSTEKGKLLKMGVCLDTLIYAMPDDAEECWDTIRYHVQTLCKQKTVDYPTLIAVDSIAAMLARAESVDEKSIADQQVAAVARTMSRGFKDIIRKLAKARVALVFINQTRDKIGGMNPFDNTTTPGGKATKFYASVRLRCNRRKTLSVQVGGTKRVTGYQCQVATVKNKLRPPHQQALWRLDFAEGPSPELSALDALIAAKRVKSSGGAYTSDLWGAERLDPATFVEMCRNDAAVWNRCLEAIAGPEVVDSSAVMDEDDED